MDENESKENEKNETERSSFYELSRKVLLAAVGAAALAQDESDHFISRLVERGEIAEKDAHRLMKEMMERREKILREKRAEWESKRTAYATRDEIDELTQRIAELNKKLDELKNVTPQS